MSVLDMLKRLRGREAQVGELKEKIRMRRDAATSVTAKYGAAPPGGGRSGDVTLMVGGTQIVELTGIEEGIVLDSEIQEAYWGETLQNSRMSGPFPALKPGANAISWSGGTVTSVKITPRWVTL